MNQTSLRLFVILGFVILGLMLAAVSAFGLIMLSQQAGTSLIPLMYRSVTWLFVALVMPVGAVIILIMRYVRPISK